MYIDLEDPGFGFSPTQERVDTETVPVFCSDLLPPTKPAVVIYQPKRYECHITIEPVFGQLLEDVRAIAEADVHGFRVADLFMQKRPQDTPERSKFDTFITGHSVSDESYNGLLQRARALSRIISNVLGVKVYRIKVEEILFDERYGGVVK